MGQTNLLSFLKSTNNEIGRGVFGVVRSIIGKKEKLVFKEIKFTNTNQQVEEQNKENLKREIRMLKKTCEENPESVLTSFIACEGEEIAPFKGCVEDDENVYIFQRMAHSSLDKKEAFDKYRDLKPIQRVVVMLKILDLVARLHKKGIIHSDIKPANIVTRDASLQEFELIDLGLAGLKGKDFIKGTNTYLPPDVYFPRTLVPELDIYALAMTFLNLEADFEKYYKRLSPGCSALPLSEHCHSELLMKLPLVLGSKQKLSDLMPVFTKALEANRDNRYDSIEKFSKAIFDNFVKFEKHHCYIHSVIKKEEERRAKLQTPNSQRQQPATPPFSWIDIAKRSGFGVEPPGFIDKLLQPFICGSKKKTQKNRTGQQEETIESETGEICLPCLSDDELEVEQEPETQKLDRKIEAAQHQKSIQNTPQGLANMHHIVV